jgi:hypothetical protein
MLTARRLFCVCTAVLMLGGCAGVPQLTSEVSSFPQWPAQRAPGRYVFERLPSQDAKPQQQAALESACAPALAAAGFAPAALPEQADVSVQLTAAVSVDTRMRYDPFWPPFGPYGAGPYGRLSHAGPWGPWGPWGPFGPPGADLPRVRAQLDVLVRDLKGKQVLYETHAVHERVGGFDARLLAPLCAAALDGFPVPAAGPREVTVTISPDNP